MPVEIRELIIKASIHSSRREAPTNTQIQRQDANPSEEVIQEIVDKVIEVLERKQER
jgi:hypothetical protein